MGTSEQIEGAARPGSAHQRDATALQRHVVQCSGDAVQLCAVWYVLSEVQQTLWIRCRFGVATRTRCARMSDSDIYGDGSRIGRFHCQSCAQHLSLTCGFLCVIIRPVLLVATEPLLRVVTQYRVQTCEGLFLNTAYPRSRQTSQHVLKAIEPQRSMEHPNLCSAIEHHMSLKNR